MPGDRLLKISVTVILAALGAGSSYVPDDRVRNASVETGRQDAAVHPVDGAAADHPAGVGQVDAQAQVQQAGIEQIQVGAVLPDIGHRLPDQRLGYLLRGIEDLLPAALVHPEDPEADVRTGTGEFGPDLIPGTADAGFADLTDGLEARLGGLALLTAGLGQLHPFAWGGSSNHPGRLSPMAPVEISWVWG